jgi:hypothetical protein
MARKVMARVAFPGGGAGRVVLFGKVDSLWVAGFLARQIKQNKSADND